MLKVLELPKLWNKSGGASVELEGNKCLQRQSSSKYRRQTLVLLWNSALQEKFNFYFSTVFLLVLRKFSFWEEDSAIGYNSIKWWDFSNIAYFRKVLSLKSFGNSWCNSYIPHLLLIITIHFTCCERKTW